MRVIASPATVRSPRSPKKWFNEIAAGRQAPFPGGAVSLDQLAAGCLCHGADGEVNYPPRVSRAVRRLPSLDSDDPVTA